MPMANETGDRLEEHGQRIAALRRRLGAMDLREFSRRFADIERETRELLVPLKRAVFQAGNMVERAGLASRDALTEAFFPQVARSGLLMAQGRLAHLYSRLLVDVYAGLPDAYVAERILRPGREADPDRAAGELREFLRQRLRPLADYEAEVTAAFGPAAMARFRLAFGQPDMAVAWVVASPSLTGSIGACRTDRGILVVKADGTALAYALDGACLGAVATPAAAPKGCSPGGDGTALVPDAASCRLLAVDGWGRQVAAFRLDPFWADPGRVLFTSACAGHGAVYAAFFDWITYHTFVLELSAPGGPRLVREKDGAKFCVAAGPDGVRLFDVIAREVTGLAAGSRRVPIDATWLRSDATAAFESEDMLLVAGGRGALACARDGRVRYHLDCIHLFGENVCPDFMFPVSGPDHLFGLYAATAGKLALLRLPPWSD